MRSTTILAKCPGFLGFLVWDINPCPAKSFSLRTVPDFEV